MSPNYATPAPDHARDGILILAGPAVKPSTVRGGASVLDIAPTALFLLNQLKMATERERTQAPVSEYPRL